MKMQYIAIVLLSIFSVGCSHSVLIPSSKNCILLDESGVMDCKIVFIQTYTGFFKYVKYTYGAVESGDPYINNKQNPGRPRFTLGHSAYGGSSGPYKIKGAGCRAIISELSRYVILHLEPLVLGEIVDVLDDQPGVWQATHEYPEEPYPNAKYRKEYYPTLRYASTEDLGKQLTGLYEVRRGKLVRIDKNNQQFHDLWQTARMNFVIASEVEDAP